MVLLLGCAFEIIMTPSEEESFEAALLTDFDSIRTRISKIDVKNADAFEKADKETIWQLVSNEMGFVRVNEAVMAKLQDWLATTALAALDKLPQSERGVSTLINQVAVLLEEQGKLQQAEPLCIEALDACRATLGNHHRNTLNTEGNYGILLLKQLNSDGLSTVQSVLQQLQSAPHQPETHLWICKFKQALEESEI